MRTHGGKVRRSGGPAALAALALASLAAPAGSVVTTACCFFGTRNVTLRVGTPAAGAVDVVRFDVGAGSSGSSLPAAPNPHGNGSPVPAATGGVPIVVTVNAPAASMPQPVATTVTSPANLTCATASTCGSDTIPFSKISWTVGATGGADFQPGTFPPGGGSVPLQSSNIAGGIFGLLGAQHVVSNTLTFLYANDVAYRAGRYQGRVTYTVSLP